MGTMPFTKAFIKEKREAFLTNLKKHIGELAAHGGTLSSKMNKFCELGSISSQDYDKRKQACKSVENSLRVYYPDCRVFMHGSSETGFGEKSADIDLLFMPSPDYTSSEIDGDVTETPRLEQVVTGEIPKTELLEMGIKCQLGFILQVLQLNSVRFSKALYIPAKIPILTFEVNENNFSFYCDLSCGDPFVKQKADLFNLLSQIDSRVKPLVFTVCCWGKYLKHIDTNKFSTYSLTLLVIFFLQNIDPPVLPSIDCISSGSSNSFCASSDICKVPKSKNASTLEDLLKQFFEFCWNCELNGNVACLRTGRIMPISEILASGDPETFEDSFICVQDPFKLSNNDTGRLNSQALRKFKLNTYVALKLMEEYSYEILFDEVKYSSFIYCFLSSKTNLMPFFIDFPKTFYLNKISSPEKTSFNLIFDSVREILHRALLLECEVIDVIDDASNCTDSGKYLNTTVSQSLEIKYPFKIDALLTVKCTAYRWIWQNRKIFDLMKLSDVEREEEISKENARKLKSYGENVFCFIFHCHKMSQIPSMTIELVQLTQSDEFNYMYKKMKSFFPKALREKLCNEWTLEQIIFEYLKTLRSN